MYIILTIRESERQGNFSKISLTDGFSSRIQVRRSSAVSSSTVSMLANDHFFDIKDRWRKLTCLSYSAVSDADGDAGVGPGIFALFDGGGTMIPAFCARLGRRKFLNFVRSLLLQDPYVLHRYVRHKHQMYYLHVLCRHCPVVLDASR